MSFSVQSLYSWYGKLIRKPKYRWWVIMGTIVYLVSPIDIAPDFIPVVGQIDDLVLLTLLVSEVSKLVIEGWKSSKAKTNSSVKDVDSKDAVIEVTKQ
ncbi:YkvA family protein [Cylindrospermopsis raciborskii]|jgi:uncharacterized membrane protein YkvA (DUF1232 family)|uniref:YkvA family protein n=1 Tax=Cylindrospermopsis raciborskii TaxID=77022 RepID=UPI0009312B4F|nr:YkvA family protein [Cylindrospermopsis raciborskii]MCZ2200656.1 YkvA family protein [Cylindrospermopsis raciborskii PAMP2012]MCZ2205605.1 YkvA family protein [Cylindrospermopsis raciborskii PAMP2011]